MSGPFGSSQLMFSSGGGAAAAAEGQSLRFNDNDSAYLSWTPASAGNRKTWTWSGWVKRGSLGTDQYLMMSESSHNTLIYLRGSGDKLAVYSGPSSSGGHYETSAAFRDTSAWYHFVVSYDSTNATAGDRLKIYVNGERVTSFSTQTNPTLNQTTDFNSTTIHYIGRDNGATLYAFDGYLSEVNFVDGLALDPTSFGETDANGKWVPIQNPSVTYGTNGFYLPFTNDYSVEGFSTVTYRGNGGTQYIGGVGFEPDLVWVKNRASSGGFHWINDSVRGAGYSLNPAAADTEKNYTAYFTAFNNDGFSLAAGTSGFNASGNSYVAWNWDAGTGSAASNTDGSITSTVKANPDYGFSIVSYTGTNSATETVGHGLSQAPDMVIVKSRDSAINFWCVYHSGVDATSPENYLMRLNTTDARLSGSVYFNNTAPTSSVFTIGTSSALNNTDNFISYCFHSVAGYSSFGSYTGNGSSTGPTVTTGFKPAFVMIKRTDSAADWQMYDNVRDTTNPITVTLAANRADAESSFVSGYDIDFNSTGFQIVTGPSTAINASGGTYIYMAFADKREAAFWLDQSGNNNDWTNNNMQESDISLDNPTNNFATLNPLASSATLSEGNLRSQYSGSGSYQTAASTMSISSGKWYVELRTTVANTYYPGFGIADITTAAASNPNSTDYLGNTNNGIAYYTNNGFFTNNAIVQSSTVTVSSGDIIGIAIDLDSAQNTYKIYQNGTLAETYNINAPANAYAFCESTLSTASAARADWNFGQDSSFHGLEVAQGNTDENGFGDFYYEPPAGYLALCTQNLPDPAIADGTEHFNTVLYTGNGSTQSITGVGFQPSLLWLKGRSSGTLPHYLQDEIRGANNTLTSNSTAAEFTSWTGHSFDSDGFTVDASYSTETNSNGNTYAAWNWKAGGTGVANTDGSISSTVSANQTAGFSIVNYTGTGSADTIGHGLSSAPEMVIIKSRTGVTNWVVYTDLVDGSWDYLYLNTTAAKANTTVFSADADTFDFSASSSVANASGGDYIAYCFHSVEGYSKFGKYTGNGSSDGPFVYTGFRPAFLMIKRTDATNDWPIQDNKRNDFNVVDKTLYADLSNAESDLDRMDFLSNGFKLRNTYAENNASGGTYIYMAFAENPFKYSNAR